MRSSRLLALVVWLPALWTVGFSGCDSGAAGQTDPPSAAYVLADSVTLRVVGQSADSIDAGDVFSDMTRVWSGDQIASDAAGVGDVRVTLPVTIEVVDSDDVTLNVEDVFGDNRFTWERLGALDEQARHIGGTFEVEMPVVIRVSGSRGVLVDLEDVFGDNAFTWAAGAASDRGGAAEAGQAVGRVGGPVRIALSVTVEVLDSRDVEVDVEDVASDMQFQWVGGDGAAAAFVGGPMRFDVPLAVRVERSERVRINLEDTAGDLTLDWTAGASQGVGGPVRFDVPTTFEVVESRDVAIDFEDQGGDNLFAWTVDGQGAAELTSEVVAETPATFRVVGSHNVRINSEDFFGDNVFVWTGPFAPDARAGLGGAVSAAVSTTFQVAGSEDVDIDAEDVFGDNLYAWDPLTADSTSPLPALVHEVVGVVTRDTVDSRRVVVEFAALNQGNRYLFGPPPEISR